MLPHLNFDKPLYQHYTIEKIIQCQEDVVEKDIVNKFYELEDINNIKDLCGY